MITLICKVCSKPYTRSPALAKKSSCCTKDCYAIWRARGFAGRTCGTCDKSLARATLKYCSRACSSKQRQVVVSARNCEACSQPLVQRPTEKLPRFAKRKFCGYACAGASRRVDVNVRRSCAWCNKPLPYREGFNSHYLRANYCSRSCFFEARSAVQIEGVRVSRDQLATLAVAVGVKPDTLRKRLSRESAT